MKLSCTFAVVLMMLLCISCSEENDPTNEAPQMEDQVEDTPEDEEEAVEEVIYFTFQDFQTGGSERWVILHDENGNLIEYQQVGNEPIAFSISEDAVPENLSVTQLSFSSDPAGNNLTHRLETYTDLEIGSVWENSADSFAGNLIGNFNLEVTNLSGVESILISTSSGTIRAGMANAEEFSGTTLQLLDIALYQDQDYVISIRDTNGLTRYLELTPENELDYSFDFDSFLEFEDAFDLELPPNNFNFIFTGGFKTDELNTYWNNGHRFAEFIGSDYGMFSLGYSDGYARYRTYVSITRDNFAYQFQTIGDKLTDITIPDRPAFTIEDTNIYDLSFSSELNPITKNSRHESIVVDAQNRRLNTTWLVYSTGISSQQIGRLPDELLERYPEMDPDNLVLKAITLSTQSFEQQQLFEDETSKRRTGNHTVESYVFRWP